MGRKAQYDYHFKAGIKHLYSYYEQHKNKYTKVKARSD